jgi:hypothetical protein
MLAVFEKRIIHRTRHRIGYLDYSQPQAPSERGLALNSKLSTILGSQQETDAQNGSMSNPRCSGSYVPEISTVYGSFHIQRDGGNLRLAVNSQMTSIKSTN